MTNGSNDRIDQLQAVLADFIAASTADRQATNEQIERDRIESNRRMTRLEQSMEQFEVLLETSYEPVQALLQALLNDQWIC